MSELSRFISDLVSRAKQSGHRYLLCIESEHSWGISTALLAQAHYSDGLWLSDKAPPNVLSVSAKKAQAWLGQDCDFLTVDLHQGLALEAMAALAGTIRGGGLMVMLLPGPKGRSSDWQSPFMQRFLSQLSSHRVLKIASGRDGKMCLPLLPEASAAVSDIAERPYGCLSDEQLNAVEAIRRVVTGHRRRPLVITADRGRGKSSALGIAAGILMKEKPRKILVTAPRQRNAETVFQHAANILGLAADSSYQLQRDGSQLCFIAPDTLLAERPSADLLIVDEAAAIPAPLLQKMLSSYSRVVFASTIHGYEGTGRGFAIKFTSVLDAMTPQWRACSMTSPIRWAAGDPLERWLFETLLLDAEPACIAEPVSAADVQYQQISPLWLAERPDSLSQLFGLLVNAHYQTSPSDLKQLLDDPDLAIFVALQDELIVGCVLLSCEGGFSAELAQAICLGQRRPRGHLLAQSVAAHLGLAEAASQHCGRILRIAVHDSARKMGIGSALLAQVQDWAVHKQLDFLGTSFAASSELLPFWHSAGYVPIRLGIVKDGASGCHSLLSVLPLSDASWSWFETATCSFSLSFLAQACEQFRLLDKAVFLPLYSQCLAQTQLQQLPSTAQRQLMHFSQGGLGYDLLVGQLSLWLQHGLQSGELTAQNGIDVMLAKVIQRQSWAELQEQFGFTGRKQAEQFLRHFVGHALQYLPH
ncbi:GNAT family N-acetyltransferase [Photobacterium sp. 2_MG-2023]|uniref:tRNA(Met) cytidine acetyltransferase TmcA n=1 Tax=Photobacterium sp. 2_MG-2023 TaxID=3062663 RepID=UPI0026E16534|nr:GNAT family N-acetyltransferase [Photobacterium sp. 2_MG-2023]MDO6582214.1 GNAT family N-acetyltransferase [Photobacterium sp. 2_MG-2023]